MGLHVCSISGGRKRGHSGGSSHESKSRVIWKETQRAVRDEENEGKEKGRRCIKKRKGQGRSASMVDVAEKIMGILRSMSRLYIVTLLI